MELEIQLINRYSRQILLPQISLQGQINLQSSHIVVVGAGGIGSSTLLYLAGAGVGTIHIIDNDIVEESNLHRQIIHNVNKLNQTKVASSNQAIKDLNPNINVIQSVKRIDSNNAIDLIGQADIVVDASDNSSTRYVLNDACIKLNIPLVSGSAVGLEGQITVIKPYESPCYRCLYPVASVIDSCRSCDNAGILGPVAGMIGCLEAIEAIKLLTNVSNEFKPLIGKQLFYDGLTSECHLFELPSRNPQCISCGELNDEEKLISNLQPTTTNKININIDIDSSLQITCNELKDKLFNGCKLILLDVRSVIQFDMINFNKFYGELDISNQLITNNNLTNLINSNKIRNFTSDKLNCTCINIPLRDLLGGYESSMEIKQYNLNQLKFIRADNNTNEQLDILILCRRGIDSKTATQYLHSNGFDNVYNVKGGLTSWRNEVDSKFPSY